MGILSRLLLLLYVLAVIAALIVSAGVCLHFIPAQVWQNELKWIISRQETIIILAIMLSASLCLLGVALSSDKKTSILSGDIELHRGESSEVMVTIPATVSVVERAALSVIGVRDAKAEVYKQSDKSPIRVKLSVVLSQSYSAPDVSAEVRVAVNGALRTALQISEVPIEIKVTEVTHAVVERERRVV